MLVIVDRPRFSQEEKTQGGVVAMEMDKVILKAIGSTLAAIVVLLLVTFSSCVIFFPSTMMYLSYNVGLEGSAIGFAERAYKRDGGIYYIACATEIAIGEEDFRNVEKCGEKFIADKEFAAYCSEMDETTADDEDINGSYAQYIYGHVFASKYKNGKKAEAVEKAFQVCPSDFPRNNAVVALTVAVLRADDKGTASDIWERLNGIYSALGETANKDYVKSVIDLIEAHTRQDG